MSTVPTGVIASVSGPSTVQLHPLAPDAFSARAATGVDMSIVFTGSMVDGPAGGVSSSERSGDGPRRYLHTGMRAAVRRPAD
jgi:hypothetical protein